MPHYNIRIANSAEISFILSCAEKEGWNPGKQDAIPFHITDPKGFFVGTLDNIPIAAISAVCYPGQFGFIGLYIVKSEFRGQGYGLQLWQTGLSYLSHCNIGLDGVLAQQNNYKKSGFILAHRNIRYKGQFIKITHSNSLVDARLIPLDKLLSYDQQLFPASRPGFIAAWLAMSGHYSLAAIQDETVTGYGTIRLCQKGYKIGPLFADNEKIADDLFLGLCAFAHDGPIFLDIPESNKAAIRLAERYGFSPDFETARMYTQSVPRVDLERIFGITTFELG
jgi:hypothetical protein